MKKDGQQDKPRQRRAVLRALSFLSQLGVTIFACLLIGVLLGKYLDKFLGTSPWLLVVFSLLGVITAVWEIYRMGTRNNS